MKVGLFIVTLLNDITQAGFVVKFHASERGIMIVYILTPNFAFAEACGKKGGTRNEMEKDLQKALLAFKEKHSIPSVTEHEENEATDTSTESKDGEEQDESAQRDEELDNTGALA